MNQQDAPLGGGAVGVGVLVVCPAGCAPVCGAGVDKGAGGRGARAGACGAGEGARAADNAGRGARTALPGSRPFFWRRSSPRGPRRGGSPPITARPPLCSGLRRLVGTVAPRFLRHSRRGPRRLGALATPAGSEGWPGRWGAPLVLLGPVRRPPPPPRRPTSACARGRGAVWRELGSTARRRDPRPASAPRGPAAPAPLPAPHHPALCSPFRFICAPFNFLSPSEKGKANKRASLFLFRACKVEDIWQRREKDLWFKAAQPSFLWQTRRVFSNPSPYTVLFFFSSV